jgi:hypothetical protein
MRRRRVSVACQSLTQDSPIVLLHSLPILGVLGFFLDSLGPSLHPSLVLETEISWLYRWTFSHLGTDLLIRKADRGLMRRTSAVQSAVLKHYRAVMHVALPGDCTANPPMDMIKRHRALCWKRPSAKSPGSRLC